MVTEQDILDQLPGLLREQTGLPVKCAQQQGPADLYLHVGQHLFVVETKTQSQAGLIEKAAQQAKHAAQQAGDHAVPLVAVPFMGELGHSICRKADVSYVDLSGNADIMAPGLRIRISGQPNQFIRRGRPSSVFAPKSSRISRLLLNAPRRWWRQSELSEQSRLGRGYVSRICSRLEEDRLIERDNEGLLRPRDPNLLLDAWKNDYDFNRHSIRAGYVASRSGEDLIHKVAQACREADCSFALTGLAASWLYSPFAAFRLVTVYINQLLHEDLLNRLSWTEEKRGANLWLIRPDDEGVLDGVEAVQGLPCVTPVQVYLDLHAMPERSEEAAEQLRKERLQWQ